jgi:tetratricopeptide (TPR) repeat protein
MCACAPALREPAPLPTLDEGQAASGPPLEDLADELWASGELEDVTRAAEGFERRIAIGRDRFDSVVAAVRAWNWLALHRPDAQGRRAAAGRAVRAAQWCSQVRPGAPECSFWLGAALGAQARERRATAIDALPRIIDLFEEAREAIPDYEHAGPDRALAVLLVRAPGFPVGPGDPDLALEHARAAVERDPDHPPNQAALGEALEAVGLAEEARTHWERSRELAAEALADGDVLAREWLNSADEALQRLDPPDR